MSPINNTKKDRVTIYEVAKACNVSLATVSRVINNRSNVTEKTRKMVLDTIERLGYRPSALAQGLAKNRSTNVGIVIPSTSYSYINNILSGMVDIAKIYGYLTTLFITKPIEEDNNIMTEKLITSHVDGAVIYDDKLNPDSLNLIQTYKIPLVIIGKDMSSKEIPSIILDYKSALEDVINTVIEDGIESINYLVYDNQGSLLTDLCTSIQDFVKSKGKKLNIIHVDDNYTSIYEKMNEHFKENREHQYFITPRDSFALAISNAALDNDLSIPNDIEILSIIGTKYSYIGRPSISSLFVDMFEVGSIAMRMLTKLLDDTLSDNVFRFKAEYNKRQSTKK